MNNHIVMRIIALCLALLGIHLILFRKRHVEIVNESKSKMFPFTEKYFSFDEELGMKIGSIVYSGIGIVIILFSIIVLISSC